MFMIHCNMVHRISKLGHMHLALHIAISKLLTHAAFFTGLLGDKACGLSPILLCGSCRSVRHLVQGVKPSAHSQVGNDNVVLLVSHTGMLCHAGGLICMTSKRCFCCLFASSLPDSTPERGIILRRHLPKCFDNVHNLEFRKDEAGDPTKGAIGMYSGTYFIHLVLCNHARQHILCIVVFQHGILPACVINLCGSCP